ncbi:MAG TPA: ATP synthase F1 subunit gamma [Candidatus Polarisedimenticolia bacterium]|nr:ATP synthase F1 subunit gamma [Candidatus Polarisedimenticolia bacterium]
MANVRDYRTRIRSVTSTQQITRAMKLVAAAKLRRAQDRILAARPYAHKMSQVLSSLALRAHPERHPLLVRRPEEKVLVVVITADKGLCGSFNTNIINKARAFLNELLGRSGAPAGSQPKGAVQVDLVGRKARDWFRRRDYPVRNVRVDLFKEVKFEDARDIASTLIENYSTGEIDAVYLVYNEFKSVMQQRVVLEQLLPIPRSALGPVPSAATAGAAPPEGGRAAGASADQAATTEEGQAEDYLYEPDQESLFAALLPKHVTTQVLRVLLESSAAEHGARMTAMENATRNAGEMINSLTLQMNKIRQAAITKEILEVVSGAEALK